MDTPEVSAALLKFLEERFPDKVPRSDAGGLFAWGMAAGKQEVVDVLRQYHLKQQDTSADVRSEGQPAKATNTRRRSRRSQPTSIRLSDA